MSKVGPYSRAHSLRVIDGRSAEAQLMKRVRAELTAHLGGSLTPVQAMLVDRAATLKLRLQLLDRQSLADGASGDPKMAIAWENALRRTLTTLGLAGAPKKQRTIEDVRAGRK